LVSDVTRVKFEVTRADRVQLNNITVTVREYHVLAANRIFGFTLSCISEIELFLDVRI